MGLIDTLLHIVNFLAPALVLGVLVPAAGRWVLPARGPLPRWWQQALAVSLAGSAVLLGGLWHFGRDGKMLTYAALVVAAATVQWLAAGGWRR